MSTQRRSRTPAPAPELNLATVMRALGDPVRLEIVRLIADGRLHSCAQVAEHVGLPASTCSYHLKQLLAAGITEVHAEGTTRYPVLRRAALDQRFPSLISLVVSAEASKAHRGASR